MPQFSETPPPLLHHSSPSSSDHDRFSTRETTPIDPPVSLHSRKPGNNINYSATALHSSWHCCTPDTTNDKLNHSDDNPSNPSTVDNSLDPLLVEPDLDLADSSFPLFPLSPPGPFSPINMDRPTSPITISSRHTSVSPPLQQASNLTSALQQAANGDRPGSISNPHGTNTSGAFKTGTVAAARKDSIGATMSQWGNGTKPIMMTGSNHNKPRRESLAGSLVGGMSWGGVSVGSWIRDDIIMTGTSPFTIQSPSYHSSSYLPKLEANFMRDFSCCGITLPSLHDLLQHYEEAHAQKSPQPPQRSAQAGQMAMPDNRAGIPGAGRQQGQPNKQLAPGPGQNRSIPSPRPGDKLQQGSNQISLGQQHHNQRGGFGGPSHTNNDLPDLDTVEDMEMDDALGGTDYQDTQSKGPMQSRFSQQNQGRVTPLNMSILQGHQGLRNSQPGTPVTPGRPLQNNPTVSSVNTPTLMTHPLQRQSSQYRGTPDSSTPGTPAGELDDSMIGEFTDMSMQNPLMGNTQTQFPGYGGAGTGNDMLNLCIDEPAKRLFSPSGGFSNSQQNASFRLGASQYGPNSQIAQRIREQQMLAGLPDTTVGLLPNEEPKPFRCPVIGCEKAYKNQNGLKYHKAHGHNNQQLHDNADGTFSIVNPETSTPYPGTLGMEKEKPYRCEVCGKRYKNLNGLKYHRSHSPPCNPELQLAAGRNLGAGGVMQGQNINVAGAGLPGIGEEGL
ncbi:hypothetical protein AJ80_00056 [Polytolypa hystricis UAMH7299]|uniref:C2H2-type domain-containing protein n=1 Tax=Polytolypa hystricis (strain UAMH7299) TaxID=1447883 RepID=A0A2B7Z2M0_POLH7|nr:hypothetical protein AJ80_00056 [Polytolypa hystricis UAMH7299]